MITRLGTFALGAALLAAPLLLAAAGYTVSAPILGYVFDQEAGSLHRVDGIPGASSMAPALDLGMVLAQAVIAPTQQFAIVRDEQGRTLFVDLSADPPEAVALEAAPGGALTAVISPAARHAALVSSETGRIHLLDGLPGLPTFGETLRLDEGVGEWTAFAISDSGAVVAASARPESGSLFLLRPGRAPARIGGVQRVSDVAFFAGRDDAVVTDSAAGEVLLYSGVETRRQSSVIASEIDAVRNPFRARPTSDGSYVAVAVAGGIASIPLAGGMPKLTPCACAPTALESLAGGNVFRLTDDLREPLMIAEVSSEVRVLFVPALPPSPEVAETR